jgi:NADPH2:quinone reductase
VASGFAPGKVVFAPAVGGSIGNATTQLARALGAKHAISSTTSHAKAQTARAHDFTDVIDLSTEGLSEGLRRLTDGHGADIVIDGIGGRILSDTLPVLAPGGAVVTLGYSGGRQATLDVTDLIWKSASIRGFLLPAESVASRHAAWKAVSDLLIAGRVKPIVAKTFALEHAAEAMRHLIEDRPFGRVVLSI